MIIVKNPLLCNVRTEDNGSAGEHPPTAIRITRTDYSQQGIRYPSWLFSFHTHATKPTINMPNPPKMKFRKLFFNSERFTELIEKQFHEEETEDITKWKVGKKVQIIEWDTIRDEPTGRLWLGEVSGWIEKMFHLGILRAVIVKIDRLPIEANNPRPLPVNKG